MYVANTPSLNIQEIDCATNLVVATIPLAFNGGYLEFIESTNEIYSGSTAPNVVLQRIDCATNTDLGNIAISGLATSITYCSINNTVYVASVGTETLDRIDVATFTLLSTRFTGVASNPFGGTYDTTLNLFYLSYNSISGIEAINPLTDTVINTFNTGGGGGFLYPNFNSFDNLLVVGTLGGLRRYAPQGVSATPYYVGGAVDYNFFTQNLESDPIKIDCFQVISSNQSQLNNNLALKERDADGHEKSNPNFPILDVSIWQQQGDRAELPLKGVILDGRTFFSQYVLNANQTVIFKICFNQLNRFCFSKYPNLFSSNQSIAINNKEKIEKEINKREFDNNGGVETKFDIIKDCDKLEVTVTNNTVNTSTFNFFESNQNSLIVNQANATFGNVNDYNFLVQQLRDSPLVVDAVEIVGLNQTQLTQPVVINTSDASGDSITYQRFPINYVATIQDANNRTIVKVNNLILDGYTTFALYNILPNSSVTFIIYYQQFKRSLFLEKQFFTRFKEPLFNDGMSFSEEMEYINEVSHISNDLKTDVNRINNNSLNTEKNVNFETEQVYSSSFSGDELKTPIFDNIKVIKKEPILNNQETFNYRKLINSNKRINYKRKLF